MFSALSRPRISRSSALLSSALALILLAILFGSPGQAKAFSKDYCYIQVPPVSECRHGNYNSIIYNRSTAANFGNNNCVYMVTQAGNFRGNGAVVCDGNGSGQARMCVSGASPMSEGRTGTRTTTDTLYGVVNNTTYDSACAV